VKELKMTRADFQKLFQRALISAAKNADKRVVAPISRSFSIELHAPSAPNHIINVDEATDHLYLGDKRFYKIIDVAIKELETDRSVVFVRASGHPPVDFGETCDPAGLGPFKHMLATTIKDNRAHNTNVEEPFRSIVGEKLSGITFVLDYWQLQFDGPSITVFTDIEVCSKESATRVGDDQFRNHLCGQIGKIVQRANVSPSEAITIAFADQSLITISLRERDYRGPEAALLHNSDGSVILVV